MPYTDKEPRIAVGSSDRDRGLLANKYELDRLTNSLPGAVQAVRAATNGSGSPDEMTIFDEKRQ